MSLNVSVLENWLGGYRAAWETRDAEGAAGLFTEGALYFETPFAEPFRGPEGIRNYWSTVTADQRDIRFESRVVGVIGSTGIAQWSARFELASSGTLVELDGVFVLEFDGERCSTLREWWHAR